MKAVILAGGRGSRLSEETGSRPKPMVEIGGRPMLWHIMKIYAAHGISEFVICCGYRGDVIKEYFATYPMRHADVTVDLVTGKVDIHRQGAEPWSVTLLETGASTETGGRIGKVAPYVDGDFCLTYGDAVGDIDVTDLIATHERTGRWATVTAVRPPARFGVLGMDGVDGDEVRQFSEKPAGDQGWINGGFFVLSPHVFGLIGADDTVWERGPMSRLVEAHQLSAYRHSGFWQPMDTVHDRQVLEDLWAGGRAPWQVW